MADVTRRSGATANPLQTLNKSTAACIVPSDVQDGDTAVFVMAQNTGTAIFTPPAGWVSLSGPDDNGTNLRTQLWAKDLTAADANTTVTFTSSIGARLPGLMEVFVGTSVAAILDALAQVPTAGTSHTSSSVVAPVDGTAILYLWALRSPVAAPGPEITVPSTQTPDTKSKTAFTASPNYTIQSSHRSTTTTAGTTYGGTPGTSNMDATSNIYTLALPPAVPVASFTVSPGLDGVAPMTATFTDTSTGSPTSWAWDFGDGTTSTVQNPSHTFTAAGSYTVSLTATNAAGASTAVTQPITVTSSAAGLSGYVLRDGVWVAITPYQFRP
jgi:hypothetical protein